MWHSESSILTEFNQEEYERLLMSECYEKGYAEGIVIGKVEKLKSFIDDGIITEDVAAEYANMTIDEFRVAVAKYCL